MQATLRTVFLFSAIAVILASGQGVTYLAQRGGPLTSTPQRMPTGSGLVEGTVLETNTNQPLEGVTVRLRLVGPAGSPETSVSTDYAGRFTFRDLPLAGFQLNAERDGYFATGSGGQRGVTITNVLGNLTNARSTANVTLYLMAGAAVSGRVTDVNGRPALRMQVTALLKEVQNGQMGLAVRGNTTTTDDRGAYRIWGLTAGEYYIRVAPPSIVQLKGKDVPLATYYPNALSPSSALPLKLRSGREENADVRMIQGTPTKISGRIVLPPQVVRGVPQYLLVPKDKLPGYVAENIEPTRVPREGGTAETFQLQANIPGTYDLYCVFRVMDGPRSGTNTDSSLLIGKASVEVRGADIDGVTIRLSAGHEVEVRFNTGGIAELAQEIPPRMTLLPRQPLSPVLNAGFGLGASGINGPGTAIQKTTLRIPEGEYVLTSPVVGLRTAYVADVSQANQSILETGTIHVGSDPPPPVEVVLAKGGGIVQGNVAATSGSAPVFVFLIPDGARRLNYLLYKRIVTTNTQFVITGITPGRYKAFAFATNPDGLERVPEFLQKHEQSARSVDVGIGVAGITLPVVPAESP